MKDRGGTASIDYPGMVGYYTCAVLGAGAAAPVAPPGTAYPFIDGSTPDYPKNCNTLSVVAAEAPTRSATGVYVITVGAAFQVPAWLMPVAEVYGTVGVWAQCGPWNAKTRQVTVHVFAAGGAATDLAGGGTPDLLVIDFKYRDTASGGVNKT